MQIRIIVFVFFALLGVGVYHNSLQNDFHYDDHHHITLNPNIKNPGNIPLFFTDQKMFSFLPGRFLHYRPMVLVSYSANYYFGKLNPTGYHMINLIFHVGSAFIIFLIVHAMIGGGSTSFFIPLASGLLFLTTPFNSEVVNYITARSSVMSAFFYLLAFYLWVRYRAEKIEDRSKTNFLPLPSYLYLGSLFAFLLGMLSKEVVITLPIVLWLYDLYFIHPRRTPHSVLRTFLNWRTYLPYLPFVFTGIFTGLVLRIAFFGAFNPSGVKQKMFFFSFITQVKVMGKYVFTMLVPVQLSSQHYIQDTLNVYFFLSVILILSLLVSSYILWRYCSSLGKIASFFIGWFFVVLLPTSVISLNKPYQENRGYLAAVGIIVLLAICLGWLRDRCGASGVVGKFIGYPVIGFLLILYSAGTITRNPVWLNNLTLWSDVLNKYPQSPDAHGAIGDHFMMRGDLGRAEAEYQAELKINSRSSEALTGLGIVYFKWKESDTAKELFHKALESEPDEIAAHYYLAKIYSERADLSSASRHLFSMIAASPKNLRAFEMLVETYAKMAKLDDAYELLNRAVAEEPDNPAVHRGLGLIHMYRGQWSYAQKAFEKVLSFLPYDQATLIDLGYIYSRLGLLDLSEKKFMQVLSIDPYEPKASQALANIYQRQGRDDEALVLYQVILKKRPKQFRSYNNIGLIYFEKGNMVRAVEALEMALRQNPYDHEARFNLAKAYESQGKKDMAKREYQMILNTKSKGENDKLINEAAQRSLAKLK